jgi:hypothetical protein
MALRTSDLTTQWQMNLPNGWGNLVTVLAQENQLFAGCNSLVYRMDLVKGAPFMQVLNLPGMGTAQKSVSLWRTALCSRERIPPRVALLPGSSAGRLCLQRMLFG